MADMNFQLVLEAVVKGQGALDKLSKSEEQIAKAAKAANDAQATTAGKAEAAMKRESEAMQRAATAAKGLGAGAHAASAASMQQASAAERVASAERRAADATHAHATAATQEAKAVQAAARADASRGKIRASTFYAQQAAAAASAGGARAAARREAAIEAASQISPNGYLLGAGAAAATGAALGATVAAGVGTMAYGLKKAIDFEKAMADVKKKVDLPAGARWSDVTSMLDRTSLAVGMARERTAALAADASGAGVAFEDLGRFTMLAAKGAAAWDMSAEDAATKMAHLKTQTQMTLPEMEDLADMIAKVADKGATREVDVVNMLERTYSSAKAAGVGLKTTIAVTAALSSGGMAPERAATFFNAFTSTLATAAKGGRGAKEAAEGFKALGTSAKAVERGMKVDAAKTMLGLFERLNKVSDKTGIGVKIFGKQWWDEFARGGDALAEIVKNLKLLSDPKNYRGTLDQNLAEDLATTSKQLERFNVMVSQIGAGLMEWSLPPINQQLQKIIDAFEKLKKSSGFLDGPDGKPIDRLAPKEPVPFSPKNRERFLPRGVDGYERSHKLKPTGYKKMFTDIEGVTPHIDVKQIDAAVADGVAEANNLYDALQKLNTSVAPQVNVGPAIENLGKLEQKLRAVSGALHSFGTFGLPSVKVPAVPSGGGPGKQSALSTGIIHAHGGLRPTHVAHGGMTVNYSPTIHAANGADHKTFAKLLEEHKRQIASIHDEHIARRGRLSFRETA